MANGRDPELTWSPLPPDIQQAQWKSAIKGAEGSRGLIGFCLCWVLVFAAGTLMAAVAGPDTLPYGVGIFAGCAVVMLIPALVEIRYLPARRRIADAAKHALARASVQDSLLRPS